MKIRELIEELEDFADQYGDDIHVVVNRNARDYPVYIMSSGVYPAYARQITSSGYFEYLDEDEEDIDPDLMPNICVIND